MREGYERCALISLGAPFFFLCKPASSLMWEKYMRRGVNLGYLNRYKSKNMKNQLSAAAWGVSTRATRSLLPFWKILYFAFPSSSLLFFKEDSAN